MYARPLLASALTTSLLSLPLLAHPRFGGAHHPPPAFQPAGNGSWGGPGDTTPTSGGPNSGGPSGPSSPSPSSPGGGGTGPATGGVAHGGGTPTGGTTTGTPKPGAGMGPGTGGEASPMFEASWDVWWFFHQDEFLDYRVGPQTALALSADPAQASAPDAAALKALLTVITRERSTEILTGALLGLARLQDPASMAALRANVASPTQRVREVSLVALGAQGDETELADLEALVRDNDAGRKLVAERVALQPRTRSFAAYALGVLAGNRPVGRSQLFAARALSDVLAKERNASADLQVACALGLGLVTLPSQPGPAGESALVQPWVSRERMFAFLESLLVDKDRPDTLRAQLPGVIARVAAHGPEPLRCQAAECLMRELLRGSAVSSAIREGCVQGLGELGDADRDPIDQRIRAVLLRATERGSQAETCLAWMALATAAARSGVGETPNAELDAVRRQLLGELGRGQTRTRSWIALALGVLENRRQRAGDAPAGESLCRSLRDALQRAQSPEEECALAMGLGLAGDVDGMDLVTKRMQKGTHTRQIGYEALALGLSRDTRQRETLRKLLQTSTYPFVLEHAAMGLALLGDPQLIPELVAGVQGKKSLEERESHVLSLAEVGDRRALPSLCSKLGDEDQAPCMRAALSRALGGICDRQAKPWYVELRTLANWRAPTLSLLTGDGMGVLETF